VYSWITWARAPPGASTERHAPAKNARRNCHLDFT
jgi:hypothetical protein